ncbi:MAG: hypothetical protein ACO376_04240 [Gammaproteobacteria bacterium]|jgi:hypothetical protein
MNTLQLRMAFVMMMGLSLATAGASSTASAPAKSEAHAQNSVAAENSANVPGVPHSGLRSIVSDEEIPAFLRTDPCDTKD